MIIYQLGLTALQQYNYFYLDLFTILSLLFAIYVITNKNPIVSVLLLICLFVSIAGYLLMIGLNFIGLSYLLVYVGAVSILFLFILMLINIRISEIQTETMSSIPLAILIGIYSCICLYSIYNTTPIPESFKSNEPKKRINLKEFISEIMSLSQKEQEQVSYVSYRQWDMNLVEILHISSIGNILYSNYLLWLVLTSIILLLAMVGTIIITVNNE